MCFDQGLFVADELEEGRPGLQDVGLCEKYSINGHVSHGCSFRVCGHVIVYKWFPQQVSTGRLPSLNVSLVDRSGMRTYHSGSVVFGKLA